MAPQIKNQDFVTLFQFVVQEVGRLEQLRQKDWKKAAEETGLDRGLPCNYDDFCNDFYECGKVAARRFYDLAEAKLRSNPKLNGRVRVETYLKPIQVELAQQALRKRKKIDQGLVAAILQEAETRTCAKLEDRTYFLPVYTLDVQDVDEYSVGPAKIVRTQTFFKNNAAELKASEETTARAVPESADPKHVAYYKDHISSLFRNASEHYARYRWIACIEIKGAEPDIGWLRSREILERTFGVLRLASHSGSGQFIGLIEENPEPLSASYMSLNSAKIFEAWSSSSYSEPHVTSQFLESYRTKVPALVNLEEIIVKSQQWQETDAIEDRLLTALFWFNEAWKETRLLPKIVKFCTSVEGLFSTAKDHEAIAEKIAERLAWLSFPADVDWHERRKTYATMKSVYGARSKAVHGDSAVNDLNLPLLAHQAEEQASLAIFAFSQLPPLFRSHADKENLLNEFFVRLKLEGLARAQQIFQQTQ